MKTATEYESVVSGFVAGTFGHAAQQMDAATMRAWIDEHRSELPAGVAAMLTTAFNLCVTNGLYAEPTP